MQDSGLKVLASDLAARLRPLFDHLRNQIESLLARRREGRELVPLVRFGHGVFAQAQFEVLPVRHRLDPLGVDLLHSPDQLEDVVELGLNRRSLRVADADPGQFREAAHLFQGQGHEKSLKAKNYLLYYSATENPLS